jgi:hypothetical protein
MRDSTGDRCIGLAPGDTHCRACGSAALGAKRDAIARFADAFIRR